MKKIENWELISESGEFKRLPAGAYICKIVEVIDFPDRELVEVYFDIADGEFKDYFKALQSNTGKNNGKTIRSYKEPAWPFFKQFIIAVEKSNPGYKWNWDEKTLTDKMVVIVFREEEYEKDGEVKISVKPDEFRSLEALKEGKIQIKPCKKLDKPVTEVAPAPVDIADEDLPF